MPIKISNPSGGAGTGNMATSTYDPANIAQQVVGTTATQTLTNKTLTSPTLGGTPTAPTNPTPTDSTTQVATDAFVQNAIAAAASTATTIRSTSGAPTVLSTDIVGDFAIDTTAGILYGPLAGTPVVGQAWNYPSYSSAVISYFQAPVNAPTVSAGAVTVPVAPEVTNVTVSATTAITMATSGAVDGQFSEVRIRDGGTAETLSWVNTENSTVSAPTSSPASSTLPTTVLFQFNGSTSKWRCVASV